MTQAVEVRLPRTADDVNESVVVIWYKSEGESVYKDEALLEVQSEKATFEIESPATGVLGEIRVKRAEVVAVGDVLAVIETEAPATETEASHEVAASAPIRTEPSQVGTLFTTTESAVSRTGIDKSTQALSPVESTSSGGFISAPPRIRRLASELGLNLTTIRGTGPGGRITEADLRGAENIVEPMSIVQPMSVVRKTIAKRMVQSLQQSAQLTLTSYADVSRLATERKSFKPGISWNTWVLAAVTRALKDHAFLNATIEDETIRQFRSVHLGIAVDTDTGLMVPVIREAEKLTLEELQRKADELANKVRVGKATPADLSGSTFTVTNLGSFGVEFFTPILNPPESAILGVGQIDKKVVFRDNSLSVMYRLPFSLTFDHRLTDGGPAARFLSTIATYLGHPEQLL